MSKLEDRVREVTTELLDNLERHERADLLHDYASQLPVAIIAEMLGVPRADARSSWSGAIMVPRYSTSV